MKESSIWQEITKAVILFATALFLVSAILALVGCSSTTETFQAPELQPVAFPIPVPPPKRICPDPPPLQLGALSLEQVEADGSILIQACIQDVLVLLEEVANDRNECLAHNEARLIVIQAEIEAREELERLKEEADDGQ